MTSTAGAQHEIPHLLRQLVTYLVAQSGRFIGVLASVPLYAVILLPAELGVVVTVQVTASVLYLTTTGGLGGGMFRFLAEHRAEGEDAAASRVVGTALITIVASTISGALLAVGSVAVLAQFGIWSEWLSPLVPAMVAMAAQAPRDVAERDLRARNRAAWWGVFTTGHQLLLTMAVLVVMLLDRHDAESVLWSIAIVNLFFAMLSVWLLGAEVVRGGWSARELRRMARFALPTVPGGYFDWLLQWADRFVLASFATLEQVGIYSLGWRMGQVVQQVGGAATQAAWDPFIFRQHRRPDGAQVIGRAATYMALVAMVMLVASVSATAPFMEVLHIADRYAGAEAVVLLVGFSYWLSLLRHILLAPTATHIRTEATLPVWAVAVVVNIVLMFVLIPPFGFVGAAWATVLAYLAAIPVAIWISRSIWVIEYEWRRLAHLAIVGFGVGAASNALVLPGLPLLRLFVEPVVALLAFAALLVVTGFVRGAEWQVITTLLRRLRGARA